MSEVTEVVEHIANPNEITLGPELEGKDICLGADPFVFQSESLWHLLLQEDLRSEPGSHDGLKTYTLRSAETIELLEKAERKPLEVGAQSENLKQVWAGEIWGDYLDVATSDGLNENHRMRVYKTLGDVHGPWEDQGTLVAPHEDDRWAIDLTRATIPVEGKEKKYAVWSGWQNPNDGFPQNLYIAEMVSPTEVGKRSLLAAPEGEWSTSEKPLLEGPQALVLDGEFYGMLVTGNASWTDKYETRILKYLGGDPLEQASWRMASESFLPKGKGIGHGVIVQDKDKTYYVGHRKTSKTPGWEDRSVFYAELDREALDAHIASI